MIFLGHYLLHFYFCFFQSKFESFFINYAPEFTDEEELKLSYYERYKEFHSMFEEQLEIFCEQMDITQTEFMRRCKSASTNDERANHYIQILLSSVEFDTFLKLMRIMRPVAIARLKADAKPTPKKQALSKKASKMEVDLEFEKEAETLELEDYAEDKGSGRGDDDDDGSKYK
jgi:hypothetical protein